MTENSIALVEAAIAGDRAAFTRLVVIYSRYVGAIAYKVLRNAHASEDVAQDVFVNALDKLHMLRVPGAFVTWLGRMAHNRALNVKRTMRPTMEADKATEQLSYIPRDRLEEQEDAVLVRQAVSGLPDDLRLMVESFYLRGDLLREIAVKYRLPIGTVKQRLHRARNILREAME